MELPYIVNNSVDLEKYVCYYSDPWKREEEYLKDNQNKSKILWDMLKNKVITTIVKKYTNQLKKDLYRSQEELFFLNHENKELYGEYFYVIDNMYESITEIIDKLKKGEKDTIITPQLFKKIEELELTIIEERKEKKKMMKFENEDKKKEMISTISKYEKKLSDYTDIIKKMGKHEKSLEELEKETAHLKEEAKKEATLLIISRIRQLTKSEEVTMEANINSEYNVFLKIKGFQELDSKLKEIIKLNQELITENGIVKIQLDKLTIKYKELLDQKKDHLKKIKKRK